MSFYRSALGASIVAVTLLFAAGCGSHSGPKVPKPMDTRGKSPSFVKGAEDGCDTAKGDYTKNHKAFNDDADYNEGWFAGRSYCQAR